MLHSWLPLSFSDLKLETKSRWQPLPHRYVAQLCIGFSCTCIPRMPDAVCTSPWWGTTFILPPFNYTTISCSKVSALSRAKLAFAIWLIQLSPFLAKWHEGVLLWIRVDSQHPLVLFTQWFLMMACNSLEVVWVTLPLSWVIQAR